MKGIRNLSDLHERSVVDDETGCWIYGGAKSVHGRPVIWYSPAQRTVSLGTFLSLVKTGERPPKGFEWRPKCGNASCCNHYHQQLLPSVRPGPMSALHKARIAKSHQARSRNTQEIVDAIRASNETGIVLAKRYGITPQSVSQIRRHQVWQPVSPWRLAA